ncbi:MAG: hypothetical protein NTW19_17500, partial [Planctomycetota bacterium]|nr:hypothetical protein [Planctomycetota bacterium]
DARLEVLRLVEEVSRSIPEFNATALKGRDLTTQLRPYCGDSAIADMLLARADGAPERFYSMSSQIAAERNDYYLELEAAQRGCLDITRWVTWFLGCLGRAIDGADQALAAVLGKAELWRTINQHSINDRQRRVIHRLLDDFKGVLTTSKYAKLAKCSTDTALRDIREMAEWGVLAQNPGGGRSTSYRLAKL